MDALIVTRPESLPAGAIVLADSDFLQHLAEVELQAGMLEVGDAEAEQEAATMLNEVTKAYSAIEKKRVELTAPFLDMQRKIKAAADGAQTRINGIKRTLDGKMTAYREAEEEKARKLEAERQAELRRQEALRQQALREVERQRREAEAKAEEERRANAAREAANQPVEVTFEEPAPPPPPPPPPVVEAPAVRPPPPPSGVKYVTFLCFDVPDAKLLKPEFQVVTPNLGAIRSMFVTGWKAGQSLPICPGVKFWTERRTQGSGR
jgi:hypothetical protein